ncbi:RsmB/NOP family class I SAM-dependent RNA methyltransferase [Roseiterribacter gracilis]|uniref:rRNA cytosine-C5-methylase n=1 Tax=Roseiterribacter gracilis TaxID=2812848 RepID=A0A8S8XL88_9PROT|nr:rRNA cytosine-C5-methylase [Rhodospirillales bacterium TMPK1]
MTPGARLQTTIELLDLVGAEPRPADATVSQFFRNRRFIGAKDRADIAQAVYRALRRRARLGWWLGRYEHPATARAVAIADQIAGEGRDADAVAGLFNGGKFAPMPLDDGERKLVRQLAGHTLDHPDMPDAVRVEVPAWAEPSLRATLGSRFAVEAAALIPAASIDLRVNALKTTREAASKQLIADGIQVSPTPLSPFGLRVVGRPSIMAHPLYRDGAIEIQDEGSQLVALLVGAQPGHQVVDLCAGAGGKTLAMAASMENKGRVIATDVLDGRLQRAKLRFRRAGAHNIETRAITGETDPWIKRHKQRFDRVLVDAPCTGTGTWRRNPDMRWRQLGPGLETLVPLQARLLDSAARLVKPGGRLAYATCSMLIDENAAQIEGFLARNPGFRVVPLSELWPATVGGTPPRNEPYLSLTPAQDDTDGFFTAVVERNPAVTVDEAATSDD